MAARFGDYVRQRRLSMGLSLRQFTLAAELDPSNHSKVERGVLPAPIGDAAERLARALGLEKDSVEWQEFHDLAAASRTPVPPDLDREQTVARLPVFFRAVRAGKTLTAENLQRLVEEIRRAG